MVSEGDMKQKNPGNGWPIIARRDKQTQRERGIGVPWPAGPCHAPASGLGQVNHAGTSVVPTAGLPASLGCQEILSQCAMAATATTPVETEVREVK